MGQKNIEKHIDKQKLGEVKHNLTSIKPTSL